MANSHDAHDPYVRGSQEISEQASTFDGFVSLAKWGALIIAAVLMLLTLWFQHGGSFVSGAIAAGVLLVAGYFLLKSSPKAH